MADKNKSTTTTVAKRIQKKQAEYLAVLEKNMGLIAPSCKSCGIDRTTHYRWMKEYPEFSARVDEIQESNIDFVEGKLLSQINDGDTGAIIWFLKCKGKRRGYVEKQEIEHSGNIGTTINIIPASKVKKDG